MPTPDAQSSARERARVAAREKQCQHCARRERRYRWARNTESRACYFIYAAQFKGRSVPAFEMRERQRYAAFIPPQRRCFARRRGAASQATAAVRADVTRKLSEAADRGSAAASRQRHGAQARGQPQRRRADDEYSTGTTRVNMPRAPALSLRKSVRHA